MKLQGSDLPSYLKKIKTKVINNGFQDIEWKVIKDSDPWKTRDVQIKSYNFPHLQPRESFHIMA